MLPILLILSLLAHQIVPTTSLLLPYVQNGTACSNSTVSGCICDDVYFGQYQYETQGCVTTLSDIQEQCCTPKVTTHLVVSTPQPLTVNEGKKT